MRPHYAILIFALLGNALADSPAQLNALSRPSSPLLPQAAVPKLILAAGLPSTGRSLLWILPGEYALEEKEQFLASAYDASAPATLKAWNPFFAARTLGIAERSYVLLSNEGLAAVKARRSVITQSLKNFKVIFDDRKALEDLKREQPETEVNGLYLIDNGRVVARYLRPELWNSFEVLPIIRSETQKFLEGKAPTQTAYSLRSSGSSVKGTAQFKTGQAQLWVQVAGTSAQAPQGSLKFRTVESGGFAVSSHPASSTRFLLDTLPPLLNKYGVQGVAFVSENTSQLPQLRKTFPAWQFVDISRPAERLKFLELAHTVIGKDGQVKGNLVLFGGESTNTAALETLLKEAAR